MRNNVRQTKPLTIKKSRADRKPARKKRRSALSNAWPNLRRSIMEKTTTNAMTLTSRPGRIRSQLFLFKEVAILLLPDAQYRQEGLLGDFHVPYHLHAFLTALLFLQQLLLARDITPITLGKHILA